jgi:hypothetical protein
VRDERGPRAGRCRLAPTPGRRGCGKPSRGLAGLISAVIGFTLLCTALPAVALAASTGPGNPLTPGLPQNPATSPTTSPAPAPTSTVVGTNSATSANGPTLSGGSATAIAVGALVILGGISLFIWRDARRRAPVRGRSAVDGPEGSRRGGSKPRTKPRKLSPAERRRRKRGRAR